MARNKFFANMSHELRTPLHGILNLAELGLNDDQVEEKDNALKSILCSTKILTNIINDILDFSKIEAGKLEVETIDFDLKTLINSITTPLKQEAKDRGILFKVCITKEVERMLKGDPVRIAQIINNLCSNAIKFTEIGQVELEVKGIGSKGRHQKIQFSIKDSGIGINETAQKNLFQDFYQADSSTSRKYGGSGLGLSICSRLSELMGGTIGFKSKEGEGSTFTYEQSFEISRKIDIPAPKTEFFDLSGTKILVAEDVKVNQLIIEKLLNEHNAEVVIVEDGKQCVDYFNDHQADIIFMDIQMPVMDGVEATKLIRDKESGKSIPIIAMTANAMKEDIDHYMSVGINYYLSKPFDLEKLSSLLRDVIKELPRYKV